LWIFSFVSPDTLNQLKSAIVSFLEQHDSTSPISDIERALLDRGHTLEDVVAAYNHLIFDDVVSCDGEIVRLVRL
jgi:hypothetical protein